MQVRLSFALLTAQESDILLLDEVMGVGDAGFMDRALNRILAMKDRAKILVMASHSEENIQLMCNKVIWLEQGKIVQFGPLAEILPAYHRAARR